MADTLTPRDIEILQSLADDEKYDSIAAHLGMTRGAVKMAIVRTLRKLECDTVNGAVATAVRRGVID